MSANAEMDHHLDAGEGAGNRRSGYGKKTVLTGNVKLALEVPRDRLAMFDPQLIASGFPGSTKRLFWSKRAA